MSFARTFNGIFSGILKWEDLDGFWQSVLDHAGDGWYIYDTEEEPPVHRADGETLAAFLKETDTLLRTLHKCPACGIVFVDDRAEPTMVKIYHPRKLGSVCGDGGEKVLPGWVLSKTPPEKLAVETPPRNPGFLARLTGRRQGA